MVRYLVSPIFFLITMLHHFIFWRSMDLNLKSIYCIGLNRALLQCRIINC